MPWEQTGCPSPQPALRQEPGQETEGHAERVARARVILAPPHLSLSPSRWGRGKGEGVLRSFLFPLLQLSGASRAVDKQDGMVNHAAIARAHFERAHVLVFGQARRQD